jgi:PTH1 family peptidyl-tRNA hydrolase
VGLGNPEGKYFSTYHNLGFLCAEELARRWGAEFKKRGNQLTAMHGDTVILKPLTYMNLSGQAVVAIQRKYKIPPENIIVICDDLYIEKGNIRVTIGGSGGGHNGIRSVNELLKTDKYMRIRIGIMPTEPPESLANYVLSKMTENETPILKGAICAAADAVQMITAGERFDTVQGKYNVKNRA